MQSNSKKKSFFPSSISNANAKAQRRSHKLPKATQRTQSLLNFCRKNNAQRKIPKKKILNGKKERKEAKTQAQSKEKNT